MEIKEEVPRILAVNMNKIGRCRVSREGIMKGYVAEIFAYIKATPIHMETFFHNDTIEYTIYSEILPGLPAGEMTPEYKFEIETSNMGRVMNVEAVLV